MPSTQINATCASEEEVNVWLKDMQEAQHAIFDQMSILETSIAMIVEELTTMKTKNKGSNHSLGQIAQLLDHVFPGNSWQMKKPWWEPPYLKDCHDAQNDDLYNKITSPPFEGCH